MSLFYLTLKSIFSRKLTSILLIVSIGLSSMLLIGVQKIKNSAKESFSHSISGTDLIVGARSGDIQLLMYTVFRQGQPVANVSWESIDAIQGMSEVDWLVPILLGDSHRGFPVMGTSIDYFDRYRYGKKQHLSFKVGVPFQQPYDVVLGSEVAKKYRYTLGDTLYLSHGISNSNLALHKNKVFTVVGILNPTGTPVDQTLHIPLEGFTALHINSKDEAAIQDIRANNLDLTPRSVTGCFIGVTSKFSIFTLQRRIMNWESEPLMAILPGVALSRLWSSIRTVDTAFFIITILVTVIAFIGLLLALFISLQQRKRELAILRTLGAHPMQISMMLILESLIITVLGVVFGIGLIMVVGLFFKPILEETMGLMLTFHALSFHELYLVLGIILFGGFISFIPAIMAYKNSVSEGFRSI